MDYWKIYSSYHKGFMMPMSEEEYFKGDKSKVVIISHDVLVEQLDIIKTYQKLLKDRENDIKKLREEDDLKKCRIGGLIVEKEKLLKKLKYYEDLPHINRRF